MRSVLDACRPRPELLAGTFNPEVFTASLSPVIEFYRSGRGVIESIYTSAELFFQEATYPTQGLRLTLAEVFGRIAGDMTVPAIHRLETAFGGGKTHTLIACTHIAHKGKELRSIIRDIIDPELLFHFCYQLLSSSDKSDSKSSLRSPRGRVSPPARLTGQADHGLLESRPKQSPPNRYVIRQTQKAHRLYPA